MAKTSMVNRERKRERLVKKYAEKRAGLKRTINDMSLAPEERMEARVKLNKYTPGFQSLQVEKPMRPDGAAEWFLSKISGWEETSCARPPCAGTYRALVKASW